MNKHGLIAGSTGTGKSRALQLVAEALSENGIPVFLSDVKGDVSGFSKPGSIERIRERLSFLKYDVAPKAFKTNYWSLSQRFIPLRISLSDLSPILISKMLQLNPTQESHLSMIFIFAREKKLRLNDLNDLKEIAVYLRDNPNESRGINSVSMDVVPDTDLIDATDKSLIEKYGAKIRGSESAVENLRLSGMSSIRTPYMNAWETKKMMSYLSEKKNPPFFISFPREISKLMRTFLRVLKLVFMIVFILMVIAVLAILFLKY